MSTPPGLILPTQQSYVPGAGNPRDSAMLAMQNANIKQANLNASVGGKRYKKLYKGGAASTVVVPQMQMLYKPTNGTGTNPNDQIKGLSSTSMQSTAWAADDNQATKMGGTKKREGTKRRAGTKRIYRKFKKGGSSFSNTNWGCYSGGKRRSKTRRHKKTSKRRRNYH